VPSRRFLVVGLTGGIGCGKSTVAALFREQGAGGTDADAVGHEVLRRRDIAARLVRAWGPSILENGKVSRSRLAAAAFRSKRQIARLNAIVHPAISRELRRRIGRARRGGGIFVLDAALLLEAGIGDWCDVIVFVDVPRAVRERRVRSRGWTPAELRRRERCQWPVSRKRKMADYVVDNGGPISDTRRQVGTIVRLLGKRRIENQTANRKSRIVN
jgi:dephospho-CoA kinase